jgi:hypothetical protein
MNLTLSLARMRQLAPLALVLVSAVVAVAVYLQALNFPFVLDDIPYIVWNAKLTGLHLGELWRLFTEPYNDLSEFLPLRELSYWFDITLFGLNPTAFRVHNIILYLLCLPLVYATTLGLWRYFRPADVAGAPWAAAAVTALFALHPALVESVVWISGRKYVLPNLFAMLALWLAVSAKREHGLSVPHAAGALLAFVAVMLSKASYVAVAPVIALLWVMFWRDIPVQNRCRSQLLWPLAILFLAGILVLVFIVSSEEREPFYFGVEAVTRTLAVLGWLARLSISSESRHFYYPVFEDPHLHVMVALGAAVLFAAVAGGVMMLRKRSLEGFALVAFLLLCMPYMQLMPYAAPSLVSDRFLALAVWPVVLLIVALSWRLNPMPRTALLLVIALSWGFQTVERPRDWRDFEALLDADLRAYPGYYMPAVYKITTFQLPRGLYREASETANRITTPEIRDILIDMIRIHHGGDADAATTGKLQDAMVMLWNLEHDLKQPPVQAKWNLPLNNLRERMPFLLATEWKYLTERFPGDVSVRYNAGLWMLDAHRYQDAAAYLRLATESQRLPKTVRGIAFESLGLAMMNSGHIAEAEAPLRAALEQTPPDLRAYCSLAEVYKQSGRFEEAARAGANCPGGLNVLRY